jgi:mannosyltransferase OCH1-like enzyme
VEAVANLRDLRLPFSLVPGFVEEKEQEVPQQVVRSKLTIPKLLHFVWIGEALPEWARYNIERFKKLNPGWVVLIHGESVLLAGLRELYAKIAGEYMLPRKSDLLRLSALTKFGGWYFDVDFLPLRPIADILALHNGLPEGFFLTRASPSLVANGVIAASVNSPILKAMLELAKQRVLTGIGLAWDALGPRLATTVHELYGGKFQLGDTAKFYPILHERRQEAQQAYQKLVAADCSDAAQQEAFGDRRPFALHMHMQGARSL